MTGRGLGLATLIVTLLAAGTAWAAFEREPPTYTTGANPTAVYAADFNGDSRPDLAVLNGTSSTVNIFLRQAAGGFAEEAGSPIRVTGGPSFGVVSNFNGDSLPDLAVAGFTGLSVSVLTRQSSGGFAIEAVPVQFRASALGAGDFNGDSQTDLVVANWDNAYVQLFLRSVNGGFSAGPSFGTGDNPRQIEVADYDGNQRADIAVTNAASNSVTVFLQTTDGLVSEGTTTVGGAPQDLVASDFNGDGRTDLAAANRAGTVSVLLRNASGFAEEAGSPIATGGSPDGITSADFNRDGRPDLAVAAEDAGVIVLVRNAGGGFTQDTTVSPGGPAGGVAAADFDADGTADIATTLTSTGLSIFRNPAPPPVPTPTPTRTPTATPVPPPVAGKSVNVKPVEGKVKVRLAGTKTYVDLSQAANLPVGTTVDARAGRVTIVAAGQGGQADFFAGQFKISQSKGSRPLTTLTLTEALSCPKRGRAASSAAAKKKSRKLWGDGKGAFRTSGKFSAATVRGTKWLVTDRCDSTTTKVTQGSVTVRDKVRRRNIVVRKGKSYTARARR